jgi:undecaprenyl-diphosphatase
MDIFQALLLGLIQGLTEFLPVSSSGHLAVLQNFFGEVNVGFDVVVHFATLFSIFVFFFKDIVAIARDLFLWKTESRNFKFAWFVIFATIPIVLVGWFFRDVIYGLFSSLFFVSIGFFISGMFLLTASFAKPVGKLKLKSAFFVGLAQALALIPGISRSGSTVSTGILSGVKRDEAIKFSFILAIPALIGASILNFPDMKNISLSIFVVGFLTAFLSGLLAIFVFLRYLKLKQFRWLAIYCFVMATLSLVLWQVL